MHGNYGNLYLEAAHAQLTGKTPGTYLVRESETMKGVIVINYVDSHGKMKEFRLQPAQNGFKVLLDFFPSLEAFLLVKKEILLTKIEFAVPQASK